MAVGKHVEKRGHITGFKEEIESANKQSEDAFFTWFNSGLDKKSSFIRGNWDFFHHILRPVINFFKEPEKLSVLEIGYGGGRILASASRYFGQAYGVDIHNHNEFVMSEFRKMGIDNAELFQSDGKTLPLLDHSVDFVYSFIVLQHVERIEIFKSYIAEAYRVLKPGGVAVLYAGRHSRFSLNKRSKYLYWLDLLFENVKLKNGFREITAKVNEVNLKVSLPFFKKLVKKSGFKIHSSLVSNKKVPDGITQYGGQHGLVLRKPQ